MVAEPPCEEGEGEGKGRKRPFTVATNDQLLVMYLSSLIRTVIALHDLVRSPPFPLPWRESVRADVCVCGAQVLNKQAAAAAADGDLDDEETSADKKDGETKEGEKAKGEKSDEKSDKEKAKEWFKGDEKGH
jgi:26S proteasome regulatory subunit N8